MSAEGVFLATDGRFVATELARGPWDPAAQHGGAPAALMMRAFEQLPASEGLLLSRVTYEFLRPVPLGELSVRVEVVRPGRRVQLLEGSLRTAAGVEVVRARALRVRAADAGSVPAPATATVTPPGPEHGRANDVRPPHRPMFAPDAVEVRFVAGAFHAAGPATAWFRLRVPLVVGEQPSALQRLAVAGDFGNGISQSLSWDEHMFINPDLTLYVGRPPVGEWIGLESHTRIAAGGIGLAESIIYDERGQVGHATQALLVAPRA
ncbi:MAG: thioesterase family protein [Solirubrobacteraceae bacterium]|jgi:hypothetical protein